MIHAPGERLVQRAFPGGTVQRTWALAGGISAMMLAVEVQLADGRSRTVVVRTHGQTAVTDKEYHLLHILHGQGVKTAAPYLLDRSTGSLVLEYLPGEMNFTPADLNNHLYQMADQMAQLHRLEIAHHDLSFLPEAGAVCGELGRERPFPNPTFPQETKIRQTLAARNPLSFAHKPTLLHGDFWPGNCLWRDGKLTAVIDWEDAQWGDPLIDLAQSRSEIAWIFGPEAVDLFTGHYRQQLQLDERQLAYRDLCAALRQIRLVGDDLVGYANYFAGYGRTDITPATICHNLNIFIDKALTRLTH